MAGDWNYLGREMNRREKDSVGPKPTPGKEKGGVSYRLYGETKRTKAVQDQRNCKKNGRDLGDFK